MYENLLDALASMGEFLRDSGFSSDNDRFGDNPDYARVVMGFYSSFITFWSKGLKFTRAKGLESGHDHFGVIMMRILGCS